MLNEDKKPKAVISIEKVYAPFFGGYSPIINRLKRMGVIDDDNKMYEISVTILAVLFASNFYDRLIMYYHENVEILMTIFSAITELWKYEDAIGMYYFILINCSLMHYPIPNELLWIANRHDVLSKYIQKFSESVIEFAKSESNYNNEFMEGEN